ncbi:MAG: imidazole glycerol phosphate synthase subunit HisH [Lentisphaeria bacterium]
MIAIVDYRAGNLASVKRALDYIGVESEITDEPAKIRAAERVIFPGVGAAGEAMRCLNELGLKKVLHEVINSGTPFMGICVGYQLLFERSDENNVDCLGVLAGNVVRFRSELRDEQTGRPLKIPQMGWNQVEFSYSHPLWEDVPEGSEFYFVHSYYPEPEPKIVCATTTYGIEYACGVAEKNLAAFQFHPEKSGRPGLQMLRNFCNWTP